MDAASEFRFGLIIDEVHERLAEIHTDITAERAVARVRPITDALGLERSDWLTLAAIAIAVIIASDRRGRPQ